MIKKSIGVLVLLCSLWIQPVFSQAPGGPECNPPAEPSGSDPDDGCDCPNGDHIDSGQYCNLPLDSYVYLLIGIGAVYGVRKLRNTVAPAA